MLHYYFGKSECHPYEQYLSKSKSIGICVFVFYSYVTVTRISFRISKVYLIGSDWIVYCVSVSSLTPFSTSSLWSLYIMNRLIFQLVLQFTEFTCRGKKSCSLGASAAVLILNISIRTRTRVRTERLCLTSLQPGWSVSS